MSWSNAKYSRLGFLEYILKYSLQQKIIINKSAQLLVNIYWLIPMDKSKNKSIISKTQSSSAVSANHKQLSNLAAINRILTKKIKEVKSHYAQKNHGQIQEQRRENQLNHMFNVRKNRLVSISKQNKQIFVKLHSQKSNYAAKQMDKSYRSSSQISRRMSRMRAASRQSNDSSISCLSNTSFTSKKSNTSSVTRNRRPKFVTQKPITCQTINVNTIDQNRLDDIRKMFLTEEVHTHAKTAENTIRKRDVRSGSQNLRLKVDKQNCNYTISGKQKHKSDANIIHHSNPHTKVLVSKLSNIENLNKLPAILGSAEKRSILTDRNRFDIYDIAEENQSIVHQHAQKMSLKVSENVNSMGKGRNVSVGWVSKQNNNVFRTLPLKKVPRAPSFLL